jgi:hypothetical protein
MIMALKSEQGGARRLIVAAAGGTIIAYGA